MGNTAISLLPYPRRLDFGYIHEMCQFNQTYFDREPGEFNQQNVTYGDRDIRNNRST